MKKWLLLGGIVIAGIAFFILTHAAPPKDDTVTTSAEYSPAALAPGEIGEGDPSVIDGPSGQVYGAVSTLHPSSVAGNPWVIDITLVRSIDHGLNWQKVATFAKGRDIPAENSTLQQETATMAKDLSDASPYKMVWNAYVMQKGEVDKSQSWISLKEAHDFGGPYGSEIKLFAGAKYDPNNSISPGKPLIYPLPGAVANCPEITEPTALSSSGGFYLAFSCINEAAGAVSVPLVKIKHTGNTYAMESHGTLITPQDAAKFTAVYGSTYPALKRTIIFAEPDLFEKNGVTYLMVTPLVPPNTRGCLVFQIADLDKGLLVRNPDGSPKLISYISGSVPEAHRGACTYSANSTGSGVIMSEVIPPNAPPPRPHLISTGVQIP